MFFSIPKFNLKSWVTPFIFENISPLLVSHTPKFVFRSPPLFEIFKISVPPFWKGGTHYASTKSTDKLINIFSQTALLDKAIFQQVNRRLFLWWSTISCRTYHNSSSKWPFLEQAPRDFQISSLLNQRYAYSFPVFSYQHCWKSLFGLVNGTKWCILLTFFDKIGEKNIKTLWMNPR